MLQRMKYDHPISSGNQLPGCGHGPEIEGSQGKNMERKGEVHVYLGTWHSLLSGAPMLLVGTGLWVGVGTKGWSLCDFACVRHWV